MGTDLTGSVVEPPKGLHALNVVKRLEGPVIISMQGTLEQQILRSLLDTREPNRVLGHGVLRKREIRSRIRCA